MYIYVSLFLNLFITECVQKVRRFLFEFTLQNCIASLHLCILLYIKKIFIVHKKA